MADLQCRLQETVNANRETLNNRAEDRRIKEQVTQSRQQQPGTAKAQEGTRQSPVAAPQTAQAQRKPPASPAVNDQAKTDQQTRLKQADQKRGVARLPVLRKELGLRRLDGVELDSIFVSYNAPAITNLGTGLLFFTSETTSFGNISTEAVENVEIAVTSATAGELTRFKPFELSPVERPAEQRIQGEVAAVQAYVASLGNDEITANTVSFSQRASLAFDYPVIVDNTLILTFLRQRWVSYRAEYEITSYFLGNPISSFTSSLTAMPSVIADVIAIKVNLETGAVEHHAQIIQSWEIANTRDAIYVNNFFTRGWFFHYNVTEKLEQIDQIISEASGIGDFFGDCGGSLFATALSAPYLYTYDTELDTNPDFLGGRWALPVRPTASLAQIDVAPLYVHSVARLMSDADLRNRDGSWLAQPRWLGLSRDKGVRVLAAAGTSAADYLEASEYNLDLSNCEQVSWLDDYWGGSFAGVNDELAEPSEVFVQDQITLPSDGAVGTPVIEPINAEAPAEPYEATVVKNIPYINRAALAEQLGGQIAWVVYRVL